MLTNNIDKLEVGQGQYTFLLNERGGIIDDLIAYRIGDKKFLLVVNASRTEEDFDVAGSTSTCGATSTNLTNRSADFGGVAIQGPRVTELRFRRIFHREITSSISKLEEMPLSIARTGYTGEDGVEVFFRAQRRGEVLEHASSIKERDLGIKPCGLGARDTLRLEMCYPLNGSDLSPERNPIEAASGSLSI